MPRKYSMERRTAIVDETRQRIVDATVELHNEKGVLATSMQDIAARAGVSLGTVYRHFPSLDELVPACGGRNLELLPPPTPAIFGGLESSEARVRALFNALYAHYEAAERPYTVAFAEAPHIPAMQRFNEGAAAHLRSLVAGAVQPLAPSEDGLGFAIVMADFRTWQAFKSAGFSTKTAAGMVGDIVVTQLSRTASGA